MLNGDTLHVPKLQPPGKGLPKIELFMARILVGMKLRLTSQEEASGVFSRQKQEILSLVNKFDPSRASKRVLIARLRGLEDSSRFWSLYMTLEHLQIVNRFSINVINSLLKGVKPQIVVSTASVKPSEDVDRSIVKLFESTCEDFETAFTPSADLESDVTLAHPWFGELNARQWHFFAGFHMSLHNKQMIKIAEEL